MTNETTLRQSATDQWEDQAFQNSSGLPSSNGGNDQLFQPFYVDAVGNLIFGYGFSITGNPGTWRSFLVNAGIPTQTITAINAYLSGSRTPTAVAAIDNSLPQNQDYRPAADAVENAYYNQVVIPRITAQLSEDHVNFANVPDSIRAALEDLVYNANSALDPGRVPGLIQALRNGNWGGALYAIATNPIQLTRGDGLGTGIENRRMAEAGIGLGYTVNRQNNATV